jgi:hypothetical protein
MTILQVKNEAGGVRCTAKLVWMIKKQQQKNKTNNLGTVVPSQRPGGCSRTVVGCGIWGIWSSRLSRVPREKQIAELEGGVQFNSFC